jgi:hypothetical protein
MISESIGQRQPTNGEAFVAARTPFHAQMARFVLGFSKTNVGEVDNVVAGAGCRAAYRRLFLRRRPRRRAF